jgi:hypothetical protein
MPERDVKSGLTQNGSPMFAPEPSFQEMLEEAAKAAPTERTPEAKPRDLALDSAQDIVRSVLEPEPSKKIADGLTTAESLGEPRDKWGHTAHEAAEIHADFEKIAPALHREATERQLSTIQSNALAAYEDAQEFGDEDEVQNAAVILRAVDPETWDSLITDAREQERYERENELSFGGYTDEEMEEAVAEEGPLDADIFAGEVEEAHTILSRALDAEQANKERTDAVYARFGNDPEQAIEGFNTAEFIARSIATDPEFARAVLGDSAEAQAIQQQFSTPLHEQRGEKFKRSLAFADAIGQEVLDAAAKEKHQGAIERAQKSVLDAPSKNVSEGLSTAQSEMTAAIQEQNRLLHANDPAKPLDVQRVVRRAFDQVVDEPLRRRETADEVRSSVASGSSRDVRTGLRDAKGRFVSVDDAIARGAGYESAADRRKQELRERQAMDRGLLR